ncbi:MAG TPA: adenosylcobinamide-GDP ribazoletransferase [Symbiobacteriaceae bacterium]|nr:adenosylcobinamide-GDP ribazoletransferase [Symbiobacteriaceae bacterium]
MRTALSFLTRIPVSPLDRFHVENYYKMLGRQAPLFPVVGMIVGAASLGAGLAADEVFGPAVRAVAALAAGVWITGALHFDGLMDTADGVGSHRSRDRMLEIMKDSRVGAMGVVAGVLSLLARYALLQELAGPAFWQALLLAPALGRMAIAGAAGRFPTAGSGTGAAFAQHVGLWQAAGALASGAACAWAIGGGRGAAAWVVAVAVAWLTGRGLAARLGGLTGDTYGAINEITEIAVYCTFAARI